jgi:hypothetical protein
MSIIVKRFCLGLLLASVAPCHAAAEDAAQLPTLALPLAVALPAIEIRPVAVRAAKHANFEQEQVSQTARHVADWVVDSGDSRGMPFAIVDKTDAKVFVFDADGRLRGTAPALLGLAVGDDSVPGIGDRAMASIRPEERTTPAGRYVAALGRNARGKEILWVDYEGAVSMHPVVTSKPAERRLQRLATRTPLDNRISFGCINVPVKFFDNVVRPAFTASDGIVYVLPESKSARAVFASYDVEEHAQLQVAGPPVLLPVPSTAAKF